MIGEIEICVTAEIARYSIGLWPSSVGTLHTNSSSKYNYVSSDMGIERYLIAGATVGVSGTASYKNYARHAYGTHERQLSTEKEASVF